MPQYALPITKGDLSKISDWILRNVDVPNEVVSRLSDGSAQTSSGSLTRVLQLYRKIEELNALPDYATAFHERQNIWQMLRTDFRVFTAQSEAFFVLFDRLTSTPPEGAAGEKLKQAREYYDDICQKMHRHLVEFLAGLLLMVEGSETRIDDRLKVIGFCISEPPCLALPIGPFVFMGVVMFLGILGVVAIVRPSSGSLPLPLTAFLIGTTKTIGVLAAVLPKLRWCAFRPGLGTNANVRASCWPSIDATAAASYGLPVDAT